jgi:hypothetical protein
MITIRRRLAVINGFVEVPDGQLRFRTSLRPADVLAIIPAATYVRRSPWNPRQGVLQLDQQFIVLPDEGSTAGPAMDYFELLRQAAATNPVP